MDRRELPQGRRRRRPGPGVRLAEAELRQAIPDGHRLLAYIQALRIEEAKQLLETTSIAVEAIGREVGYEDASSFRRLFRRLAGIGPAEYRRKLQPPKMIGAIDRPGDSRRARVA